MKEEKYIEAMFHYTHGIKQDPYNGYLYSNRSLAFLRMQQYYYALQDAKTTIQLMPKWTKVCRMIQYLLKVCHRSLLGKCEQLVNTTELQHAF